MKTGPRKITAFKPAFDNLDPPEINSRNIRAQQVVSCEAQMAAVIVVSLAAAMLPASVSETITGTALPFSFFIQASQKVNFLGVAVQLVWRFQIKRQIPEPRMVDDCFQHTEANEPSPIFS